MIVVNTGWMSRSKNDTKKSFLALQEAIMWVLSCILTDNSSVYPLLEKLYDDNMGLFEDITIKLKNHFDTFSIDADRDLLPKSAPELELKLFVILVTNLLIKKSQYEAMVWLFGTFVLIFVGSVPKILAQSISQHCEYRAIV
jgi:hypothetical protein